MQRSALKKIFDYNVMKFGNGGDGRCQWMARRHVYNK
jgi:hypothetical protein